MHLNLEFLTWPFDFVDLLVHVMVVVEKIVRLEFNRKKLAWVDDCLGMQLEAEVGVVHVERLVAVELKLL